MSHIPGPPPPRSPNPWPSPNAQPPRPTPPPQAPLGGDGLLSGAHNPLLVIGFFLGAMAAVGFAALSALYDLNPADPLDIQANTLEHAQTVLMLCAGGAFVSGMSAFIMRKPGVGVAILLLPPLVAGGLYAWRWKTYDDRFQAAEKKRIELEERVAAMKRVREHFAGFCDSPAPDRKARKAGKAGKGGLHLATVARGWDFDFALTEFETTSVGKVDRVACLTRRQVTHSTCLYELGGTLGRNAWPVDIVLYEASTGNKVFETTLEPKEPVPDCPFSISDRESGSSINRSVEVADIVAAIKPHLKSKRRRRK